MNSEPKTKERSNVNQNTLIPLGVAAAIVVAAVTHFRWMDAQFSELRQEVRDLRQALNQQWTVQDMEVFALRVKTLNSGFNVPDVNEIRARRIPAK